MYHCVVLCVFFLDNVRGGLSSKSTTAKTYELQVPGSSSIKIIEAEPIWDETPTTQKNQKFEHRAFNNRPDNENKFSPDALKQFLKDYANKIKPSNKPKPNGDSIKTELPEDVDKRHYNEDGEDYVESTKSWDMLKVQRHNHPYEDKKGWVTLEAVPWSVSKVSKWHSNNRNHNNPRPWENTNQKPWENDYDEPATHKPYYSNYNQRPFNNYQIKPVSNYDYMPNDEDDYFQQKRPTAFYAQKVYLQQTQPHYNAHEDAIQKPSWNKRPHFNHYDKYQMQNQQQDDFGYASDIITDGRPADFPHHSINRRRGGNNPHRQQENDHFSGDGDWVLVSTTRGYKYPKNRERSMKIASDVGAHRTVRLTVLPPLKDSKVNMTTSHGGLLQVESTFETVEEDHKNKQKQKPTTTRKPNRINKVTKPTITETTIRNTFNTRKSGADSSAVLAAVGAGMIPATMAMLVPMALGGRRRKREVNHTTAPPTNLQITIPRTL